MSTEHTGPTRNPRVDHIIADYLASGETLIAVARRHGVSPVAVYKAARRRNIDTSPAARKARIALTVDVDLRTGSND